MVINSDNGCEFYWVSSVGKHVNKRKKWDNYVTNTVCWVSIPGIVRNKKRDVVYTPMKYKGLVVNNITLIKE